MYIKKIFLSLTTGLFITSCTGQTNTSSSSDNFKPSSEFLNNENTHNIAYGTQTQKSRGTYDSNMIARILEKNALRYNYKMPQWPMFQSAQGREVITNSNKKIGNFYGINKELINEKNYTAGEIAAKIIERWNNLDVDLGFLESNPDSDRNTINDHHFYSAMKNKPFNKKLVLMGDKTKSTHDSLKKEYSNSEWNEFKNMATFEFSEIITAYNTGYQTQANFGLKIKEKNGELVYEKLSVGYLVAAIKRDERDLKIKNVRKAVAFRQGVLDAVAEQNTGEAKFVSKKELSENESEQNLFWSSGDIGRWAKTVGSLKNYKNADHSIFYMAGAGARENTTAADGLVLSSVTNLYGHKMVVEKSHDDKGVFEGFSKESGTNLRAGSSDSSHVRARIRMNGRYYSTKNELDEDWHQAKNAANGLITEAVIESLYGNNLGKINYFGKHNFFGNLGVIDPVGTKGNRVHINSQKLNINFQKKIKSVLIAKEFDITKFEDDFMSSGY